MSSKNKRQQTLGEEIVNALTHGIGAVVSVSAVTLLIVFASLQEDPWKIVGVSIYGGALILLLLASTLYHGVQHPRAKFFLNLFDHCAIYLLIAGTYTPFLLVNLRGVLGWSMFGVVWGLALVGIVCKLCFHGRFKTIHLFNYLIMGWVGIVATPELMATLSSNAFAMIIAGGLAYTIGVVFYVWDRFPYAHSIWHLFVLGGSTCHYIAVYNGVL
ncbi:hemolysin III family protein [Hahella aquimaris]|uniref:PAQR family membrane homeostasis protein TrhA n=1 Tax=Hahella sp. HNIBRBA332 TaxID=3015983 RepID=UPI00273C2820|nr:hemolysin III family protein [Hahella sp. HNIBRBA332]WLQ15035.1 hemolysin III family protein [Hahella sp. HNIBRBA332]